MSAKLLPIFIFHFEGSTKYPGETQELLQGNAPLQSVMAGLYFHIPFCKQACHYCDFHFSTTGKDMQDMVKAQLMELESRSEWLSGEEVETIYFGGGTPSLLATDDIRRIGDKVNELFEVHADVEITLEANPDDLSPQKLKELRSSNINRLSIGIQSFRDSDLEFMNRSHRAAQSEYAVKAAQDAGFENITVDLIYAIPGLDDAAWKDNIDKAASLQVPHLSAYCLTVEQKTVFGKRHEKGLFPEVESAVAENHFLMAVDLLGGHGLHQYEVSNFARPGMESRHNSSYWKGSKYLGIGPSAHSFDGQKRRWNISNNPRYIRGVFGNEMLFEEEVLDDRTRYNEYVMTSLRTTRGLDAQWVEQQYGVDFVADHSEIIEKLIDAGKMIQKGTIFTLSPAGFLWADKISSDFFKV